MTFVFWLEFLALAVLGAALGLVVLSVNPGSKLKQGADAARVAASAAEQVPIPLWQTDPTGKIVWSNTAYQTLVSGEGNIGFALVEGRASVDTIEGTQWFDIVIRSGFGHARPVDDLVRAEANLRDMVQAMAKTFAQLPTGLAVFDANRHLQSFNPALADLTGLSPEFLSRRPSLIAMLDGMRDRNTVPEPKDWKGWRHQLADMERAAVSAQFEDVWTLPGGQTYRVRGRRHLDGGLALMIDDISSEIIRSRRYRADLELCQRVVDTIDDGIAVFAANGQLVMSNTAYADLWGHDPGEQLSPMGIGQLAAHWRSMSAPTTLWSQAEDFAATLEGRTPWQGEARLLDGRLITCHVSPLSDGATLIAFRTARAEIFPRVLSANVAGA